MDLLYKVTIKIIMKIILYIHFKCFDFELQYGNKQFVAYLEIYIFFC